MQIGPLRVTSFRLQSPSRAVLQGSTDHLLADFVRFRSESDQLCWILGQFSSTSVELGPYLVDSGYELAEFGPHLAELVPNSVDSGQNWPRFVELGPSLATLRPRLAICSQIWQHRTRLGPIPVGFRSAPTERAGYCQTNLRSGRRSFRLRGHPPYHPLDPEWANCHQRLPPAGHRGSPGHQLSQFSCSPD